MKIRGRTVGTTMPRTNYEQTDPAKADYLRGKEKLDESISKAQTTANNANTAAENAKTSANNAQTTANEAKTAAGKAQTTADDAVPKAGGTMTGALNVLAPTENTHAANKGYVDEKRKVFTATLTVNDWVGDKAPYTQSIGIEGILSTDQPHYSPVYDANQETRVVQKEAFACVDDLDTANGSVTFTCFEDKPEVNIPIQMEVNR